MKAKRHLIVSLFAALCIAVCGLCVTLLPTPAAAEESYDNVYDFTAATDFNQLSAFSAGIDPAANSAELGYNSDGWVTYERQLSQLFTLENGLKVNTAAYSGEDVSENNIYVRLNTQNYTEFKAELVYSYDNADRNGWAGFILNYVNYARKARWGDSPNGVEMFVQREGKGTYSSSKLNNSGYSEGIVPANWQAVGEHTLNITATKDGITFIADGTEVISVSAALMQEKGLELGGSIGFVFSNAQFTAKKFSVTDLSEPVVVPEVYNSVYDFSAATDFNAAADFKAGIDPAENNPELGYNGDTWVTHARELNQLFNLNNGLQVNTNVLSGNDVSENNIYVRLNTKQYTYFKAELVYSYDNADRNGWAGFILGYTNFDRKARWGDSPNGIELFVQKEGKGTYSSSKLNNSNYTEGAAPADWEILGEHTLKVIVIKDKITLFADGAEVISISAATMAEKGYTVSAGNVGFMFNNAQFTAKKFSISELDENGNAELIRANSIEVSAPAEAVQFENVEVNVNVLPENAADRNYKFILPEGAAANGNSIVFSTPGKYTVGVQSVDNSEVYTSFEIQINGAENRVYYATDAENINKNFETYYVTNGGSKDGKLENYSSYWTLNEDGTITLTEKKENSVDAGYVFLYLKDVVNGMSVKTNNFEISYAVKSTDTAPNGWHGVGFVLGDRTTTPNQDGISAFIQEEATKATLWGSGEGGVGGPTEKDSLYRRREWNLIKVRVYGEGQSKIEMYVNDMTTPAVTTTAAGLTAKDIALFTTTTITLGNIYYAQLDGQGNAVELIYPETLTVTNPITEATVGDKYTIESTIAPAEVTDKGLLYTSSNALVAAVGADGIVSFMNAGTAVITISCKANPAVTATLEITVKDKEVLPTSIEFDNLPTEAKVGGKFTLFVTVLPENATNYDVTYSSSNEEVATIDEEGRISYVGAGVTTITVKCVADESVTNSFELTVTADGEETSSNNGGGDAVDCGDCSSSAGAGSLIACAMLGLGMLLKKRK